MGSDWQNQLEMACKADEERRTRYATTGRKCGCGYCFCCAALRVERAEIGRFCGCGHCIWCDAVLEVSPVLEMLEKRAIDTANIEAARKMKENRYGETVYGPPRGPDAALDIWK